MIYQKRGGFDPKYILIIFLVVVLIVVVLAIVLKSSKIEEMEVCGDGTFYENCSSIKPYFCENGTLIEKASVCGCSELTNQSDDLCISEYATTSKDITLNYILRGEEGEVGFTVYKEMYDYLSNVSRVIYYEGGEEPSKADFKIKSMDEEEQRELLMPLVVEIQNLAESEEDQIRVAVSVVQNIDYGASNKTTSLGDNYVNYSRYPYEVLYDEKGICGEKSSLLAFLLREMGYGTSLFYYAQENHEAVGINCSIKKSFNNTGYCFIETTGPSIITDNSIEYVGGITLDSEPQILTLSEGEALGRGLYEYKDAKTMERLRERRYVFFADSKLRKLQEKYGLIEEYYIE